jgi:2-oxoglutarate dehydrogenase complex dehydrogenase (E1) component-like enzyme
VEQIAPFPYDHFKSEAIKYTNAEFVIAQEEHQNQGAWFYLEQRVHNVLSGLKEEGLVKHSHVHFCGRRPSSSTAAGSAKIHNIELEKLLEKLFS